MPNWFKLLVSLILCYGVAFAGSLVTTPSITSWYNTLNKPFFNPPNWIFGPVWTLLYTLMAFSLFLVWKEKTSKKTKPALIAFGVQLVLNFLWSFMFFYLHQPLLAFIAIVALWISILLTIKKFNTVSKTASQLLIPYILWVTFASLLNLTIVLLNL